MSYIGKEPADSFISFAKQDFSTSATTSYTLDNAVANENELALFINFVRQEPTTAYTASGTTLTLTSATASTDDMYCVYLGQAKQTVNPPDGSVSAASQLASDSVTAAKLNDDIISGQTALASEPATTDELLISDAGTLKRIDFSLISNRPAIIGTLSGHISAANNTDTTVTFNTRTLDTDNCLDITTNTGRFTPTVAGYYFFNAKVGYDINADTEKVQVLVRKNGSEFLRHRRKHDYDSANQQQTISVQGLGQANGSSDYFEVIYYQNSGGSITVRQEPERTRFDVFRLIGV